MARVKSISKVREGLGLAELTAPSYQIVSKSADEKRITMGIMYPTDTVDLHGEFAKSDDLEDSVYDYVRRGDFKLRKQHGRGVIGEIVAIMPWPFPVEAEVQRFGAGGIAKSEKISFPAGSVFATAHWTPDGWEDVKRGRIGGFSMGGRAVRVAETLE